MELPSKGPIELLASIKVLSPPACGSNATMALLSGYTDAGFIELFGGNNSINNQIVTLLNANNGTLSRLVDTTIKLPNNGQRDLDAALATASLDTTDTLLSSIEELLALQSILQQSEKTLRQCGTAAFKELCQVEIPETYTVNNAKVITNPVATVFLYRNPYRQAVSYMRTDAEEQAEFDVSDTLQDYATKNPAEALGLRNLLNYLENYQPGKRETLYLVNYDTIGADPIAFLNVVQRNFPQDIFKDVADPAMLLNNWRDMSNECKRNLHLFAPALKDSPKFRKVFESDGFTYEPYQQPVDISHLPENWQKYIRREAADIFQQLENHPLNMSNQLAMEQQNTRG